MLLLVIIYLAFISLGLPDAVLGSSWPVISKDLNASLEFAGVVSIVITSGTVISSLLATKVIDRFGTGKVVAVSVVMTAIALLGFSFSNYVLALILLAIPLGLGAGAVDAALNNFVALHYQAKHMNYLHSFWGVGATAGPLVMATYLTLEGGWRYGYATLAALQFVLVVALFATLPLWKKGTFTTHTGDDDQESLSLLSNRQALKIEGVKKQLILFGCYCSLEAGTGLWAASYLTVIKGVSAVDAAFWTAVYYLGITVGRFICGVLASRVKEEHLIRFGVVTILVGVLVLLVPVSTTINQMALLLIGLGCAPIYPNTIHLTPKRFGKQASQAVIGLSMATAYTGVTLVPPMIGLLMGNVSFALFPYLLVVMSVLMIVMSERLVRQHQAQIKLAKQQG
ncbi:MFS transporter [Vibrio taketomensis]|uniref:MFS transporter n=1 Tax=Vibrio taketomensis TaxID=2572923 RepID=UPI0013897ECA|nr:MFS transporter [Vibrio taketomensis]